LIKLFGSQQQSSSVEITSFGDKWGGEEKGEEGKGDGVPIRGKERGERKKERKR